MIDLSSYPKFKQDSEQSHVTIYPLVIIDNQYYMSTVKESMLTEEGGSLLSFKDYNLKISNIKESTDIENHNFKISNVTLDLNNYEINGQRLSDVLVLKTNKNVEIYYKTQSCQYLSDCLPVYKGSLRKIDHDNSNVRITLEDLTQSKFHKDVPVANIGFSENILNKDYQNKPIPITYGYVDKAPAILYKESSGFLGDTNIYVITDDISVVTGNNRNISMVGFDLDNNAFSLDGCKMIEDAKNPLHIYKGDYYRILEEFNSTADPDSDYTIYNQYKIDESTDFIKIEKEFEGQTPKNPPAFNEFQAVKVRIPSEFESLGLNTADENGYIYDDQGAAGQQGHSLLNINSPVYGSENCLISPDFPSKFNEINSFNSFTEIPNSQIANSFNDNLLVSQFCNYTIADGSQGWQYSGIHYPINNILANGTNFNALINAWVSCNAHSLPVKFIGLPPADMIQKRLSEKLQQDGLIVEGIDEPYNEFDTGNARIAYQCEITPAMKSSWKDASGFDGTESTEVSYFSTSGSFEGDFISETYNWYDNDYRYKSFLGASNTNYNDLYMAQNRDLANTRSLYDDTFKDENSPKTVFPSLVYHFKIENSENLNSGNSLHILIGQKNDSMNEYSLTNYSSSDNTPLVFYNLFNDGSGNEYLFEMDEFPVFDPKTLVFKSNFTRDRNIGCKFDSEWNGVPIGTYPYEDYKTYSCLADTTLLLNGGFPGAQVETGLDNSIKSEDIGAFNPTYGNYGANWAMLVEDVIEDPLSDSYSEAGSLGEYTNNSIKGIIKKGTLLNVKTLTKATSDANTKYTGFQLGYEYIIPNDQNYFTVSPLVPGTYGTAEQRATSLLTLPSLDIEDEVFTKTFAYGKVLVEFPGNAQNTTTNVDDNSRFLFGIGAADVTENGTDFTAELPVNGVNIIDIQESENNTLTNGGIVNWNIAKNSDLLDAENVYIDKELFEWGSPNDYNAITLTSRAFSITPNLEHYISAKTKIFNVGLLHFITFENIFKSDFYVDTIGRADIFQEANEETGFKYTNEPYSEIKLVIENPADIIYHFVEKELGYLDIINEESWLNCRENHENYRFGFSVKETINSKKLIEDISKNTSLYPKFTLDGKFGFDFIKKTYSNNDINSIITKKDVLDISFTRTPIENIHTLVNVKYKKDYAEDEYTRQTGYCDPYDFFGNGDGFEQGTVFEQIFNASAGLESGYKYSYYGLNREDKILEFESDYIRNQETAIDLRNFLLMQNANQHNIVNCTLTLKNINLETGDVIKFSELINNLKCYGEDYTQEVARNGQIIYPYFMITSITKSSKNIKITAMQLHKLNYSETSNTIGDLSRFGGNTRNYEDVNILNKYILGQYPYITTKQLRQADSLFPYSGNVIDYNDLNVLLALVGTDYQISFDEYGTEFVFYPPVPDPVEFDPVAIGEYAYQYDADGNVMTNEDGSPMFTDNMSGDANNDTIINIVDVVGIVSFILGDPVEGYNYQLADINNDGVVNVVDVVAIVNYILS